MFKATITVLLMAGSAFALDAGLWEKNKVTVSSHLPDGQILRKGMGFLFDETTVVCSYTDVKGAAQLRVQWDGHERTTNRVISYSEEMDLIVIGTEEELPLAITLGSSSMLAIGDPVLFWQTKDGAVELLETTVEDVIDTGKGYDVLRIQIDPEPRSPSPLYNSSGKVVGWLQGKRAIPIETIAMMLQNKEIPVLISDLNNAEGSWKLKKLRGESQETSFRVSELQTLRGSSIFPFRIDLPEHWKHQQYKFSGRLLLRSEGRLSGILVEVRAEDPVSDDLIAAIERTETLIFTDLARSEMIPYSADHLTGFRARYEDSDPEQPHSLVAFYTMSAGKFYVVSVWFPASLADQARALIDQILSSFRL